MRIAIPTWCGRVSPVFDVAKCLLLVDVEGDAEVGRQEARLEESRLASRARRTAELGVDTLVCGAISAPLEAMLVSAGVRVTSHACGPVDEVLRAFLTGRLLMEDAFLMPGCGRPRRRARGRHRGGQPGFSAPGGVA